MGDDQAFDLRFYRYLYGLLTGAVTPALKFFIFIGRILAIVNEQMGVLGKGYLWVQFH
jgi:hypothetical protein